jgi:hypothetical protein
MHRVAARAGESLGSLVSPVLEEAPVRRAAPRRGPVHMAPTAAQPLVRTGSTQPEEAVERAARAARTDTSREIPAWFEAAARRHLADTSGSGDGITLAEMTLVTAAPPQQVAARTVSIDAVPTPPPSPAGAQEGALPPPDVEQIAREVYAQIIRMIEVARERSGDPWLS